MPAVPIIAGVGALGSAVASHIGGNKARAQARYQAAQSEKQAEAQFRAQQENFEKSRTDAQRQFDATLRADTDRHRENMALQREAMEANKQAMAQQLAQAQAGLMQQQAQHEATLAQARQAQNNANAQLQRQINGAEKDQAHYNKKSDGVAGTILTGPGGIDPQELEQKKKRKTLLGE